jgi:DNA polymerase-3 subunit beta
MAISCTLPPSECQISEDATVAIPANLLKTLATTCQDDTLHFAVAEQAVYITGQSSQFKVATADPTEFPLAEIDCADGVLEVPVIDMERLYRHTQYATAKDKVRYVLDSVLLEWDQTTSRLIAVATDGAHLAKDEAYASHRGPSAFQKNGRALVPKHAWDTLAHLVAQQEGFVKLRADENRLYVEHELTQTKYTCALSDGKYPNWRAVAAGQPVNCVLRFQAGELRQKTREAAVLLQPCAIGLNWQIDDGRVRICTETELGEADITIPVDYHGDPMMVRLHGYRLRNFLASLDEADVVEVHIADPQSPVIFHVGDTYKYIIMPMA